MKIAIFGANGATGRLLVARALSQGHHVVAAVRRPEAFPPLPGSQGGELEVVKTDALSLDDTAAAINGVDAVLSTMGVPFTRQPIDIYSVGTANIVEAMTASSVRRLVVVSSSAVYPHHHADGGFLLNRVLQPIIVRTLGKTTYQDMRVMEELIKASDLDWTVMRPSGLYDLPAATAYRLDENEAPGTFTARIDLAAAMLDQLRDDFYVRKVAAVTTTVDNPSLWAMVRAEASSKKS